MDLGTRIAYRLRELGLTQVELARKSGLTQQVISQYIRGKSKPGFDAVTALIDGLEVEPDWFFRPGEYDDTPVTDLPPPRRRYRRRAEALDASVLTYTRRSTQIPLVIGHWLPLQDFPPPTQVRSHGIIMSLYSLIFNQLVQSTSSGQIHGALAIDWKPAQNSWVFQLREGVRFHNGRPVKAEDVVWSYEQHLHRNAQDYQIESVRVLDSSFIQIQLKSPCRLDELARPFIVPFGTKPPIAEFIGTGAYHAVELTPGFWRLESNPRYYAGRPYFREIQVRQFADAGALEEALHSGKVHMAIGVHAPAEDYIAKAEPSASRYHLHFMMHQPEVQNQVFRQAVSLALDRRALAEAAGLKEPLYASGPFDYILKDSSYAAPLNHPDAAAQLLQQVPGAQEATIRVGYQESVPHNRPLAEAVVQGLTEIGLRAEVGDDPHLEIAIRPVDLLQNECAMWATADLYNLNGYSNQEVDERIQGLKDAGVESHQLLELRQLIQRDLPDIPLFYQETLFTHLKHLRALENREILLGRFNEVQTWYLDQTAVALEEQSMQALAEEQPMQTPTVEPQEAGEDQSGEDQTQEEE